MSKRVSADQISIAIERELTLYNQRIIDGIKKQAKTSANQLVKQTKATAPVGKRTKHYRDSIAAKRMYETDRAVQYVWYVKGSDYRLSHLLENGHASRNGGRVAGTHFIKNASDPILAEYMRKVEEVIKNG